MSACVKCNNVGNGNIWQSTAGFGGSPCHRVAFCQNLPGHKLGCKISPHAPGLDTDHLDVTCGACGYTWAEPCKDAKP